MKQIDTKGVKAIVFSERMMNVKNFHLMNRYEQNNNC